MAGSSSGEKSPRLLVKCIDKALPLS